jgi:hypothetical protein
MEDGMKNVSCLKEKYKDVFGYEGLYQVSNYGNVKSIDRLIRNSRNKNCFVKCSGKKIKPFFKNGYKFVALSKNGKPRHHYIHRLVLTAFVGPPKSKKECRHLDGNRRNNNVSNLEWGTRKQNMADAIEHGRTTRGEKNARSKLKKEEVWLIRKILKAKVASQYFVAKMFKTSQANISMIGTRTNWGWLE